MKDFERIDMLELQFRDLKKAIRIEANKLGTDKTEPIESQISELILANTLYRILYRAENQDPDAIRYSDLK